MKAAPDDQLRLLDLQRLDSDLARHAHRRATLPEIAETAGLSKRASELADDVVLVRTRDHDLGREQAKVDADVEVVRSRLTRDQGRLDAGTVSSPKELESLQSEIASLRRRQSDLEDVELEVMERREAVQSQLAGLTAAAAGVTDDLSAAETRRDATFAEIDGEVGSLTGERAGLAGRLPADLLALYERLRTSSGGVGAAALTRGRCDGCHLQLTTADLNRLRAAAGDEVVRCEECNRILVRTAESGL